MTDYAHANIDAALRENARLRAALEYDAAMFARLAKSLVGFRTTAGMGATMRVRADRLNKLLNAAPAARPDRPAGAGAAESLGVKGPQFQS